MKYYTYDIIFPPQFPYLPDKEEVMRKCKSLLYQAADMQYALLISEKINAVVDPYLREYMATVMHHLLLSECTCEDSPVALCGQALEHIELDLQRIVRRARDEQQLEQLAADSELCVLPDQDNTAAPAHIRSLEKRVEALSRNMQQVMQLLQGAIMVTQRWPFYEANATMSDRYLFENQLTALCTSKLRSATAQIKTYLALKEAQHIIRRPQQINEEYALLVTFGYSHAEKTYYNQ